MKFALVSAFLVLLALHTQAQNFRGGGVHFPAHTQGHLYRGHVVPDNIVAEGVHVESIALPEGHVEGANLPADVPLSEEGHNDLYGTASVNTVTKVEYNAFSPEEHVETIATAEGDPEALARDTDSPGNTDSNMALFVNTGFPLHLGFVNIVGGGAFGSGRHVNSVGNTLSGPVPVVYPGPLPVAQNIHVPRAQNVHTPNGYNNGVSEQQNRHMSGKLGTSAPATLGNLPPVNHGTPTPGMMKKSLPKSQTEADDSDFDVHETTTMPTKEDNIDFNISTLTTNVPAFIRHFSPITMAPKSLSSENRQESDSNSHGYVRVERGDSYHTTQDLAASQNYFIPSDSLDFVDSDDEFVPVTESGFFPVDGFVPVTAVGATASEGGFVPATPTGSSSTRQNITAPEFLEGFVPVTQTSFERRREALPQNEASSSHAGVTPMVKNMPHKPNVLPRRFTSASSSDSESRNNDNVARVQQDNFINEFGRGRLFPHRFGNNANNLQNPDGLARSSVIFNFGAPRPLHFGPPPNNEQAIRGSQGGAASFEEDSPITFVFPETRQDGTSNNYETKVISSPGELTGTESDNSFNSVDNPGSLDEGDDTVISIGRYSVAYEASGHASAENQ